MPQHVDQDHEEDGETRGQVEGPDALAREARHRVEGGGRRTTASTPIYRAPES